MNSSVTRPAESVWVRVSAISLAVLAGCAVLLVLAALTWEFRYRGAREAIQEAVQQRQQAPHPPMPTPWKD
jgi:type VI protein secretion system component VasK